MYLIIDFGLTRAANKIKKKAWYKSFTDRELRIYRRGFSSDKLSPSEPFGYNKAGKEVWRGKDRWNIRKDNNQPQVTRKPRSGERSDRSYIKNERIPDNKNFTDIRKVKDNALSPTGYIGFRNTPNSYFEEPVPIIESGKKIKVKPRITSLEY